MTVTGLLGDESEHFQTRALIVDGGVSAFSDEKVWFEDVLSSQ